MPGLRRTLLVSHAFLPDSHAGVEVYTWRLATALQERGQEVVVACGRLRPGRDQGEVLEERVAGIRVLGIVQNWPRRGGEEAWADVALDRSFASILRRERPELVAVQSLQGLSIGFLSVARQSGARLAVHLHDSHAVCPSGGQRLHPDGDRCEPVRPERCADCFSRWCLPDGLLERWGRRGSRLLPAGLPPDLLHRGWRVLPSAIQDRARGWNERLRPTSRPAGTLDAVGRTAAFATALLQAQVLISPSEALPRSLRADGLSIGPVQVVPTGVPRPARRTALPGLDGGRPLAVRFIGTWLPHKGPQVLAEALRGMDPEDAVRIDAQGIGPAPSPTFRDEVLRLAEGRLVDLGPTEPSGIAQQIRAADIVVIPSIWAENSPLIALEARAEGRPVLATDGGGLPEVILDGADGWIVPRGDEVALRDRLVALGRDRGALAAMAASVREPPSVADWVTAVVAAWETA